jgi:hypothetical protein
VSVAVERTATEAAVAAPEPEYRDQYCPVCRGYLGPTASVPGLRLGTVRHRIPCHSSRCRGKQRWVDLAGGVVRPNTRGEVVD